MPIAAPIAEDNPGFQMLLRMGFQKGQGLGREGREGRTQPVAASMKFDRLGLGLAAATRDREDAEIREIQGRRGEQRQALERLQHSFAHSQSERYAARQAAALLRKARAVLHRLDTERDGQQQGGGAETADSGAGSLGRDGGGPPINLYWGLPLVARVLRERGVRPWIAPQVQQEQSQQRPMMLRLSEPPPLAVRSFEDAVGNVYSKLAPSAASDAAPAAVVGSTQAVQLPPPDHPDYPTAAHLESLAPSLGPEQLQELEDQLPAVELQRRLVELLEWLRAEHLHCVYCGHSFVSEAELEQRCPGVLEEDH